jgi:Cd2+/Zn2+-exporting ATPase/Cu+-exporting ATPase
MWCVTMALVAALLLGERVAALVLLACGLVADLLVRIGTLHSQRARYDLLRQLGLTAKTDTPSSKSASIERTANQVAACLAWSAAAAAGLTFAMTRNVDAALSVTMVVGLAGAVLAPRLVVRSALGRAAQAGILIRDGACLEGMWGLDTVVLDNTIVSSGERRVHAVYPATGVANADLLETAAMAESRSDHAIGRAIVEHASRQGITIREPERFAASPGQGVSARCHGQQVLVGTGKFVTDGRFLETPEQERSQTVYVTRGGAYLGAIAVSSRVSPAVQQAVAELTELGIQTKLLSPDRGPGIAQIAKKPGADGWVSGFLPAIDAERLTALARERRLAVVGGACADSNQPAHLVAVTFMAAGNAVVNSEILLTNNDLGQLAVAVRIARQARRATWIAVAGTIAVDVCGIAAVAGDLLTPLTAALVHVSSSLAFIFNAARLIPRKPSGLVSGSRSDGKLIQ